MYSLRSSGAKLALKIPSIIEPVIVCVLSGGSFEYALSTVSISLDFGFSFLYLTRSVNASPFCGRSAYNVNAYIAERTLIRVHGGGVRYCFVWI